MSLRTVALAAIAAVAMVAVGCGGDDEPPQRTPTTPSQEDANSTNKVEQDASNPAVRKAQRELAAKAKKQKAEAIADARNVAPEGRSDLKCAAFGIADDITPTGHNCADAKALIKAGGTKWVALPTVDTTKIHGYRCSQVEKNSRRIKVRCYDISGTIAFTVPVS